MTLPAGKPTVKDQPGDEEDIFVVHASFTSGLHQVRGLNEADAFTEWIGGRSVDATRIQGRTLREPFYHLQALFWTQEGTNLEHAHVIRERALERSWGGELPC